DLPSPLPFTGGSGITTLIISSLALLGASLVGVLIYRRRKNA
ncbi:MAG: LPXTG cell wall anchor domain-containing protein, partial [Aeriscardovia sp.]|nr:LPXTG cell wall anchor domain-containing protein [Aeriscardovia sp.]